MWRGFPARSGEDGKKPAVRAGFGQLVATAATIAATAAVAAAIITATIAVTAAIAAVMETAVATFYYIFQVFALLQAVVEAKCDEDKFHKDKEVQHMMLLLPMGEGWGEGSK